MKTETTTTTDKKLDPGEMAYSLFGPIESRLKLLSEDFLPREILDAASIDADPRVRTAAAAHPFASRWVIDHCLKDPDPAVRDAAAKHPGFFVEEFFATPQRKIVPAPKTIVLVEEIGQQIRRDVYAFIAGEGISVENAFDAAEHVFLDADGQTDWIEAQNFLACSLASQVSEVVARRLGDKDESPNFFRQMDRLGCSAADSLFFAEQALRMPDEQVIRDFNVAFRHQNHFQILDRLAFEGQWGLERTACAVAKSAVFLSVNWPLLRRWLAMRIGKRQLIKDALAAATDYVEQKREYPELIQIPRQWFQAREEV